MAALLRGVNVETIRELVNLGRQRPRVDPGTSRVQQHQRFSRTEVGIPQPVIADVFCLSRSFVHQTNETAPDPVHLRRLPTTTADRRKLAIGLYIRPLAAKNSTHRRPAFC